MAVRAALGGSRWRLVRQLLTESVLLAMSGGVLGTALAYGALQVILTLVPPDTIPDESEVAVNVPVLLFALAVSGATSVIFGLAPALHTCTRDLINPLRSSGRSVTGGTAQALLRKSLVVGAVALSIMLMVGASLMIRTRARGRSCRARLSTRPGVDAQGASARAKVPRSGSSGALLRGASPEHRPRAGGHSRRGQHVGAPIRWRWLGRRGPWLDGERTAGRHAPNQRGLHESTRDCRPEGTRARLPRTSPDAGRSRWSIRPSSARASTAPTRSAGSSACRG